jgi:tetratricopeptide (TPR) repeat protein
MAMADLLAQGPEGGAGFVVESERRLSRSLLWTLQRRYFERAGIDAWRTATVPHHVTNNPALAHAYAQVFLGFLRDCVGAGPAPGPSDPFTLVELGAGCGRFAFVFLRAFIAMLRTSSLASVPFRYVLTDFDPENVRFCSRHEALAPFVTQGVLDFAVFDAERDGEIRLLHAGATLGPASLGAPLGVIANYVLDGISHDAFSFQDGELRESLVSLSADEPDLDLSAPGVLDRLTITSTQRPAPLDYYEEVELNGILRGYAGSPGEAMILFPGAALRCLGRLAALSGGRMLLLSGDRGEIDEEAVRAGAGLGLLVHGSFSLPVNHHAIAAYVRARGGQVLRPAHRHAHLLVTAFLLGADPTAHGETRLAWELSLGGAGPDEVSSLRSVLRSSQDRLELAQLLAFIRLSRWDPRILHDCLSTLLNRAEDAPEAERADVVGAVRRCWENYYPIGEPVDVPFDLGLALHGLGAHADAIALFEASIRLYGDHPATRWNVGLCHHERGDAEAASASFAAAARLDPGFVPEGAARALQVKRLPTPPLPGVPRG